MSEDKKWQFELEEYIRQGEPEQDDHAVQSAMEEVSKGKICTLEEVAILKLIVENPNITQKEIANRIGKSERTVKNKVASLKENGYIRILNGKRNGKWEVLIKFDMGI